MLKTALISRLVFLQLSGLIIEVLPIRIEDRVDVVGKGLLTHFHSIYIITYLLITPCLNTYDLSFASTETKFIKPKTKTQNNFLVNTGFLVKFDLSFASTETKFKNPITKTQNNIGIFGFFHKKMILSFWLFLK